MTIPITLTSSSRFNTGYAPLAVLGYCLTQCDFCAPLHSLVQLPMRTREYTPTAKLEDCLISILAGCTAVQQINVRLRPDRTLARAWGRTQFAEQSTIADTLDACLPETIRQLRAVHECLLQRFSRTLHHDFSEGALWIDIDLSPLPTSRRAEASTKGYIPEKKTHMDANWFGCVHPSIMKPCSLC
jgi:hypothetical protein